MKLLKRLFFIFKRKDKKYKTTIEHNVVDIFGLDNNNYSNTLYNIYCSINNIPCDLVARTKDYDKMIDSVSSYNQLDHILLRFTNTIYNILFIKADIHLPKFVAMLNTTKAIYIIKDNSISLSLTLLDLQKLYLIDEDNDYLNIIKSYLHNNFDSRLYKDINIEAENWDCYENIMEKNGKRNMLPLYENDNNIHIYVIENHLLNFFKFNSINIDLTEYDMKVKDVEKLFKIIICFDNLSTTYKDLLKKCSIDYLEEPENNRLHSSFNLDSIYNIINELSTYEKTDESFLLYRYFRNLYLDIKDNLLKINNINIQMTSITSDDKESINFIDDVDEIL